MAEVGGVKDPVEKQVAGINGLISKEWILIRIGPPALVVLISFLCYGANLSHELVGDDLVLIPKQKAFHNPTDLQAILSSTIWGEIHERQPIYRPLVTWTLALNHGVNRLLGFPVGYHLVNVLLHTVAACLVLRFFLSKGFPILAGLSAGLLFAAHPIHTEAVCLVTNRSEMLGAVFGLLFLIAHMRRRWYGCPYQFLALVSKESVIAVLPLAI